jgi:hypothetical protein
MEKCQFVIYRYETDISKLKKDGRYKNLEKVAQSLGATAYDYDYRPEDPTRFQFGDEARKKIIVHEYWGNFDVNDDGIAEPIVCAWVNDVIIRLQDNPYPDGKPPFIVVPFNAVPFQMHGEANAELIGDNQKIKTAVIRGIIDNMAQSNNGQIGIRKGALDLVNRKKWMQGKNFEFNGTRDDFWQGGYNPIPSSAFDMIGLMNNEIESLTGVKSFSGGINGNSLGNMLCVNTNIPMADGSNKLLKDINDGDYIVGSDGKATKVVKAHEIKMPKKAFNIAFSNGDIIKSGVEHLWTVKVDTGSSKGKWHTVDTDTLFNYFNSYYGDNRKGERKRGVYIPRIQKVDTGNPWNLSVDPYLLGYWLGDGTSNHSSITTADAEIVSYYEEKGFSLVKQAQTGAAFVYRVNKGTSETSFEMQLKQAGLLEVGTKIEKFIPEEVFTANYESKMELIRGLVDSDGYIPMGRNKTGFAQICQSEGRLKEDIVRLLLSMGLEVKIQAISAELQNKRKENSVHNGSLNIVSRKTAYKIGFSAFDCPARLPRKADRWTTPKFKGTHLITSMEVVDNVPMRCLTVDSEDKLYACGFNWTLTHNTATGASRAMDATSVRRMNIVRNIAENLVKPLLRKWMAYNSEFLEDEEVVRVTNSEFVPVRRDDLAGAIDIDLSIATAEDNAAKSQELSFLLQTMGQSLPFDVTKHIMADIMELMRMPDKAERLRTFEQPQDPMAEKAKELELMKMQMEIETMKADIADKHARAAENQIDAKLKEQKVQVEANKARLLGSQADKLDLDWLAKESGADLDHELTLEELRAQARKDEKLSLEELRHRSKMDQKTLDMMKADKDRESKMKVGA